MQVLGVKDVPGHQSAAEDGGEIKEKRHLIAVAEILVGQHESGHAGKQQSGQGARRCDKNGDPIGPQQITRDAEKHLVGIQGKILGDQLVAVELDGLLVGKGAADDQQERQQADEGQQGQQNIGDRVESNPVPPHGPAVGVFQFTHGILLPPGQNRA